MDNAVAVQMMHVSTKAVPKPFVRDLMKKGAVVGGERPARIGKDITLWRIVRFIGRPARAVAFPFPRHLVPRQVGKERMDHFVSVTNTQPIAQPAINFQHGDGRAIGRQ